MNKHQIAAFAGGLGLLVGAVSFGFFTGPSEPQQQSGIGGTQIIGEQRFRLSVPPDISDQDWFDAQEAYLAGDPLPPGVTFTEFGGKIDAYLTGVVNARTGEYQVLATVLDDAEDLDEARIYFNDSLLASVDRAGGGIVDRAGGRSKATLSTFVPDPATVDPYEVVVEWTGLAASTFNSSVYKR